MGRPLDLGRSLLPCVGVCAPNDVGRFEDVSKESEDSVTQMIRLSKSYRDNIQEEMEKVPARRAPPARARF